MGLSPRTPSGRSALPVTSTPPGRTDRKSTRLNSSHDQISYAVFCLKKKKKNKDTLFRQKRQTILTLLLSARKSGQSSKTLLDVSSSWGHLADESYRDIPVTCLTVS